ncbi:MAG TPA: hypothetical protein VF116_06840 [Ktedonobacterales bacterium]
MSENTPKRWERELQAQAIDGELYRAGMLAGAAAARSDWPRVERLPQRVLGKCQRELKQVFGASSDATGVVEYRAGWLEGYAQRCAQLDQRPLGSGPN